MATIRRDAIQLRDPFIFTEEGRYVLTGTSDANPWRGEAKGFMAWVSTDLEHFEEAGYLFEANPHFWGTQNFWAPEFHRYEGRYYLFASFIAPGRNRATAILRSESGVFGPYKPWGDEQVTPKEWMCLDGTLHVDAAGEPWVVFCREWVQPGGGTVCASRLSHDLTRALGKPFTLFAAAQAPWATRVRHTSGIDGMVTDGPFLWKLPGGKLAMLFSSVSGEQYALGQAVSERGVLGPWAQQPRALFSGDGGHGMLFWDLAGALRLAIHTPNQTPNERPIFLHASESRDGIAIRAFAEQPA